MNWKIKAHALAVLSRAPGGTCVYRALQRWAGTNRLTFDESLERAANLIDLIREAGRQPSGAVCVEIGTGWRPFVPILLRLAGAERIITFDVTPWLTRRYLVETLVAIGDHLDAVCGRLNLSESLIRERLRAPAGPQRPLRAQLDSLHIEYRCPGDARSTGLPGDSVDLVVSSNALEHIPPAILADIHKESARILKPSGVAAHRFNPQDHFAGVDRRITGANFLQFSSRQWHWYGGSGLSYHNRLRCPQHRVLFEQSGFRVLVDRVRTDERGLRTIRRGELRVHPEFQQFTPEEVAADYMWMVGAKSSMCSSGSQLVPAGSANRPVLHNG